MSIDVSIFHSLGEVMHDGCVEVHEWARKKGFWEGGTDARNKSEMLMLMVTELAEVCEGLRHGNPQDDKIPAFTSEEAELADCVIRIMDYAGAYDLRLGEAIAAKMVFNEGRPHKHGKKF